MSTQVQVRKGAAVLEPPSTQEAQMIKKEPYWRLTCRACVARDAEDERGEGGERESCLSG